MYASVYVCVSERETGQRVYMCVCVCASVYVCVCVCVREREGGAHCIYCSGNGMVSVCSDNAPVSVFIKLFSVSTIASDWNVNIWLFEIINKPIR